MNAQVDVTNIRIETPRLILRPWRDGDLADFYEYASVPGVGEMAGWCHHKSREESRNVLDMFIRGKNTLALELKETGKVIGSLGLEEMGTDPVKVHKIGREIGYVLSRDYWGRGLVPEAVRAIIAYCFQVLNWDYLTCCHFTENSQSRRVIEKAGFRYCQDITYDTQMGTSVISKLYVIHNPKK